MVFSLPQYQAEGTYWASPQLVSIFYSMAAALSIANKAWAYRIPERSPPLSVGVGEMMNKPTCTLPFVLSTLQGSMMLALQEYKEKRIGEYERNVPLVLLRFDGFVRKGLTNGQYNNETSVVKLPA